ncbi:MAG: hypothetical protein NTX52_13485 [Planctomycetota bacterium]|nr:hypothetical protein [Planctomycetota bacterium]
MNVAQLILALLIILSCVCVILAIREYLAIRKILIEKFTKPGSTSVYSIASARCKFQPVVTGMFGGLEEERLIQEEGVKTKENITQLRRKLTLLSGITGKGVQRID